jgi:hypothetical protein
MKRTWSVLVAVAVLAGCLGGLDPIPDRKYGFILTSADADGAGHSTRPLGVFYQSRPLNLPSIIPLDTCLVSRYDSNAVVDPNLDFLDAGDSVGITMKLGTSSRLEPIDSAGQHIYRPLAALTFTPGDTMTADIPGAGSGGFPELTITGKTAEPFTIQAITPPPVGQPLQLRWDAATLPGSKMIVSLRYRVGSGDINQLYCDMADDGSFDVPADQLNAWRDAAVRQAVAFRLRITSRTASNALLQLVSSYSVPTPAAP